MKKIIEISGDKTEVELKHLSEDKIIFELSGEEFIYYILSKNKERVIMQNDGTVLSSHSFALSPDGKKQIFVGQREAIVKIEPKAQKSSSLASMSAGSLQSPMPGKIFKILKQKGESVEIGEGVLILEAMKMEHTIKATSSGVIKEIFFSEGSQVTDGVLLCEIE